MNVSIEQLAEQHGLTQYADDSYTQHELYLTIEQVANSTDWIVWSIDNEVLAQGSFSECCAYIKPLLAGYAIEEGCIALELVEVAQTLVKSVLASDYQYYQAKDVLLAKHCGWSNRAITKLPLNY